MTIRGVTDPFTPFIPSSPGPRPASPVPGMRYVLVDVVFEAAEDKLFEAAPWYIVLHDTEGNQWGYETGLLPPDATTRELPGPQDGAR